MEPSRSYQTASDSEDVEVPDPKRSRKMAGAATYKTKFKQAWIKEFPLSAVKHNPYRQVVAILKACFAIINF